MTRRKVRWWYDKEFTRRKSTLQSESFQNLSCFSLDKPWSCLDSSSLLSFVLSQKFKQVHGITWHFNTQRLGCMSRNGSNSDLEKKIMTTCWTGPASATRERWGEETRREEELPVEDLWRRLVRFLCRQAPPPWTAPPPYVPSRFLDPGLTLLPLKRGAKR